MLKIGQKVFGKNLTDVYNEIFEKFKTPVIEHALFQILKMYSSSSFAKKDQLCVDILLECTNNLKKIAIVGCVFPITYLINIKEKYPDIEFVIIDEGHILSLIEKYLKEKFNATLMPINPLFNDITDHLKDVDLIIYPETELLVPFDMLKYKNKKPIFAVNFFYLDYKLNINQAFNEDDLADMCLMSTDHISGQIDLGSKKAYYVLGNPDAC
jgi:hypothetical protein